MNKSNEIKLIRFYKAPLKVIWEAWNNPTKASQWCSPRGFTITSHSKDLREGGAWSYTMHGPDGVNYTNYSKYLEVIMYQKVVYDHGGGENAPPMFRVTMNFSEEGGYTKLEMTMTLPTPEMAENLRKYIKSASGDAAWDRLGEFLEKEKSGKEIFVINRTFNASAEKLFKMWTDPKQLSRWLAPTGFTINFIRADIKAGGNSFYYMTDGDKTKFYGKTNYLVINPPTQLLYTQQFCDEKENISRHPMAPTWPGTMETRVKFIKIDSENTVVNVEWEPYGTFSQDELNTFINARSGMTQGWTGSFDKLETYLMQTSSA